MASPFDARSVGRVGLRYRGPAGVGHLELAPAAPPAVAMSFDRLAPHYRWMELVLAGNKLQRCRISFLDRVPSPRRILMAGEGHGRMLVECRRRFPAAFITYLDSSVGMHAMARRGLEAAGLDAGRVEFVQSDVLEWCHRGADHDLIVTHFFLDCFGPEQLEVVVQGLSRAARPECDWLIADFQEARGWIRGIRSRVILAAMYTFFRAVTALPARSLAVPDRALERAGFVRQARCETEWGLLSSAWWRRGVGGNREGIPANFAPA